MPVIDNLNNDQKANGIPFTSLPEEDSPSDYGYMVVTDDILKLKRITRGNFFKGIFAGGNVLSGRGLPDDGLGHDGDVYINIGTDITTITDFQVNTLPLNFWSWYADDMGDYGYINYDIPSIAPYQPEYMSYHSENGVLNNLNIRNYKCSDAQKYKGTNTELFLKDFFDRGGVIGFVFSGIIEDSDYPVQYPAGIYNISFDLTVQGSDGSLHGRTITEGETIIGDDGNTYWNCRVTKDPYFAVANFTTNHPPASNNRRDHEGYRNDNKIAHVHAVCLDESKPEDYGKVVINRYNYEYQSAPEWLSCIPIENEFGTYHVDFTSEIKGSSGSPSFMLDLNAAKCDIIDGGPASFAINNLRITPVTIYAEAIQDIWLKSEGRWNKDDFVLDDDIEFDCPAYMPGTTIARVRYKGETYFLKVPENYSDIDSVGITREYQTGTEVFYMDIDGQRTRVYSPPSEYEIGYLQGYRSTDPNGRKIYTDEISTLPINGLTTTYSGSTRFIAKRNALYKVVFHMNIYKNDRGNLVCYTNKESFYAKIDMANPTWSWVDGPPEVRIPAKDFEGTRFSVYSELIGYIETSENSNEEIPRFILDIGGKNFMYSNSYEIMVYFNTVMTRIR